MAEYIDREEIFPNGVFYVNKNQPEKSLDELINRICKAPAADVVEVVHGHWIKGGEEKLYFAYDTSGIYDFPLVCSNCKTDVTEYDYEETPFCPMCGAKMDGERRSENESV